MRLIVVLVSLVLAFSLNAQPLNNIGPEVFTSAMPESVSAQRAQPVTFVPVGRRAAPQVEPSVWTPWEAAVVVRSTGQVGTSDIFSVMLMIFTYLPYGAMVEKWARKPNGEIYLPSVDRMDVTSPGAPWQGWIWNAPLPADWPAGVTTFEVVVTINGKKYTAVARVAIGGIYPAGDPPQFGPLEEAIVDSVGGVLLRGIFKTSPVVVSPTWIVKKISLEGDYYIPPGAIGTGSRPLGVCSGLNGNPFYLDCSTRIVPIPVF